MNLIFSLTHNGKPTHFPEKIITGLYNSGEFRQFGRIIPKEVNDITNSSYWNWGVFEDMDLKDKIHTIRKDEKNRWSKGRDIHFIINPYNCNRIQFAPVIPVKSIQYIEIDIYTEKVYLLGRWLGNSKKDLILTPQQIEELAHNDGFDTVADFWDYFNEPFIGKIIHWTNKYYK